MLTERANLQQRAPEDDEDRSPDTLAKYVAMFQRRVAKGQCFHRPYLGVREFACQFAPAEGSDQPLAWNESLGFMLYDIQFKSDGVKCPGFFDAKVTNGILHCDTEDPGAHGEPPVTIHGWSDLEDKS